jgi:hypothetical protein
MKYLDNLGHPKSVDPPTKYLTFGPWIYLVPQYKPESVLILGYAGGTVAGLIHLLYGDVPITGVDIEPCENLYGVEFVQADAKEYVKTCKHFGAVVVDLFLNEVTDVCDFVNTKEFVTDLTRIANYIIVNSLKGKDMSAYDSLKFVGRNRPSGLSNLIYYYQTVEIPDLHL